MYTQIKEISDQAKKCHKAILRKWLKEGKDGELLNHLVSCHPRFMQSYMDMAIYGQSRMIMTPENTEKVFNWAIRYRKRLKKYCT